MHVPQLHAVVLGVAHLAAALDGARHGRHAAVAEAVGHQELVHAVVLVEFRLDGLPDLFPGHVPEPRLVHALVRVGRHDATHVGSVAHFAGQQQRTDDATLKVFALVHGHTTRWLQSGAWNSSSAAGTASRHVSLSIHATKFGANLPPSRVQLSDPHHA